MKGRKRLVGFPKPFRHIRMMVECPSFDVVAEFRDLPVANLKCGMIMDMAPALQRQVGTGLLLWWSEMAGVRGCMGGCYGVASERR